jgi:hypothetical protein
LLWPNEQLSLLNSKKIAFALSLSLSLSLSHPFTLSFNNKLQTPLHSSCPKLLNFSLPLTFQAHMYTLCINLTKISELFFVFFSICPNLGAQAVSVWCFRSLLINLEILTNSWRSFFWSGRLFIQFYLNFLRSLPMKTF